MVTGVALAQAGKSPTLSVGSSDGRGLAVWALGGGALVSAEAFKRAMHTLRRFANDKVLFDALFAFTDHVRLNLAPSPQS